jgi:hypothetical protein
MTRGDLKEAKDSLFRLKKKKALGREKYQKQLEH